MASVEESTGGESKDNAYIILKRFTDVFANVFLLIRPPVSALCAQADTAFLNLDGMDEICMKMQSTETGLMVKTLKYFRVSVPASFSVGPKVLSINSQEYRLLGFVSKNFSKITFEGMWWRKLKSTMPDFIKEGQVPGQDLIEWLSRTLKIDDNAECVHLANQLCVYGYLFPVFDNATTSIRDNNTLYRSQIPYFWPSLNSNPDDVEYAIYLSKRLLRNEEKHGLSESEAEAFNKTRELLGHMWDFIQNQAEMQLKLFKEKKKVEKVVFDSQEKAFWRVHRPQHGQSVCLDERYGKLEKKIRKRTSKEYHQELDRLKFALKTKPWLKSPKAVETLVSGCEQFTEYDSFLTPLKDPSNPWITDDQSLWVLNADIVEVPTERRVKRWGFAIQELMQDIIGRQVFETFLESEFSQENIRFWSAVQDLKYSPKTQVPQKVDAIYHEFLASGAPCQVNVDSRTLEAVNKAMADKKRPPRYNFSAAEEHIFILMSKDSYPRFIRSEIYKGVLNAAMQQGAKKLGWRAFIFGNAPNRRYAPASSAGKPSIKTSRDESLSSGPPPPKQLTADSWIPKILQRSADSSDNVQPPCASFSSISLAGVISSDTQRKSSDHSGSISNAEITLSVPNEDEKHSTNAPYQSHR